LPESLPVKGLKAASIGNQNRFILYRMKHLLSSAPQNERFRGRSVPPAHGADIAAAIGFMDDISGNTAAPGP